MTYALLSHDSCHDCTCCLRSGELPASYVHVWACTTDCGPDQIGSRNSLKSLFATDKAYANQIMFDLGCLKHQYHLMVQDVLRMTDDRLRKASHDFDALARMKFKYFATLAMTVHNWRANAKKIVAAWKLLFPTAAREDKATCTLPPTAVAGRWGSITCWDSVDETFRMLRSCNSLTD